MGGVQKGCSGVEKWGETGECRKGWRKGEGKEEEVTKVLPRGKREGGVGKTDKSRTGGTVQGEP